MRFKKVYTTQLLKMDEVIEKVKGKSEAIHLKLDVTLLKNAAKSMFVISMGPNT